MLRYLLPALFLFSLMTLEHHALAALPPEAQKEKEKDAIRESKELSGRIIHRMTMYEENGTRYYQVEADCIYQFAVEYHRHPLELLGWVGPKKFSVSLQGNPDCQTPIVKKLSRSDLKAIIYGYISDIYHIPKSAIRPNMSLYHIVVKLEEPGMDFRVLALRERLDKQDNCRIETDLFMTIRTVSDLLRRANQHCASPE